MNLELEKGSEINLVTITRITYDDLNDLSNLYEELLGKKTNLQKFKDKFTLINSNKNYILIGAKDSDNTLVGSLLGIICQDLGGECKPFMVVENVIVKNNCRRMGIGKTLMTFIESFARKKDCYFTMLVSAFKRKDAHKFYESIGYNNDVVKGFKKYL
ncbi:MULTISPECIES: GNAT family N-acetyltransferase [Clostridium]|uniref:Aminoalkylphosphonic acid N-acetyltransferase n=2 Tax=Clostridium TaxID=1485 RepID=D8GSG3_CLOLD|nr:MULTISPECIES: GNAT family N-acetyltransferase [Clostridium]ADK16545.1 predicted acetyltransferase, GNAT family [Clostridium ljungdahlii DSM 13528]AGY75638.1 GNAT family N-acetyltransferase [Clostridium autoethanogenum DSM 10061]ALU35801.1 GCN5-related N-acetyltransferase [Clostridium autoethanogenum DSM 10061]OAA89585.1 aminoalkylphosphonic acid N-acetyltransferase [Clostridium ljungdahlii DSM 13528]OVY52140.1 aminoalkylphosphonic acid N-acetyltransferase [Clostridium autoethanogenum]